MAFAVTQTAAAGAALTRMLCECFSGQKPSALGRASGAVSGLVGITPAAGFVDVRAALIIGIITAAVCFWAVTRLKRRFAYDDSPDAFGIHGIGGIGGGILTGLLFSANIAGIDASVATRVAVQVLGMVITVVYSAVISFVLLKILDKTMCLRVEHDDERLGLDLSQHGERLE